MSQKKETKRKYNKSQNYTRKKRKQEYPDIPNLTVITSQKELYSFFNLIPENISFQKIVPNDYLQYPKELDYSIYQNLNRQSIINTFNYMYYHIRLGIFVQIQDNNILHFVPFNNPNYTNNWDKDVLQFKNNESFNNYYKEKNKKYPKNIDANIKDIEKNTLKWSANNCIIGNWNKESIGTGAWLELYEMIDSACKSNQVNDCIFFINRRDHPVLTGNGTESSYRNEPYFHIFDNLNTRLTRHSYDNYVPILSFSKNNNFADLLIPNYEDWRYIKELEEKAKEEWLSENNKELSKDSIDNYKENNPDKKISSNSKKKITNDFINNVWDEMKIRGNTSKIMKEKFKDYYQWDKKFKKAIFRGSSSGCGTNPDNNQRIRLGRISQIKGMKELMDVGILGTNIRDKKYINENIDYYDYKEYKFENKNRMEFKDQCKYKYIIHVDGHVSAYRLGKELSSGSTILKVDSLFNYKLWFSNHLIPNYHYLPIKTDLSNIKSAIESCKKNDETCEKIAENAKNLFHSINNRKYISLYFSNLINCISNKYII